MVKGENLDDSWKCGGAAVGLIWRGMTLLFIHQKSSYSPLRLSDLPLAFSFPWYSYKLAKFQRRRENEWIFRLSFFLRSSIYIIFMQEGMPFLAALQSEPYQPYDFRESFCLSFSMPEQSTIVNPVVDFSLGGRLCI